MREINIYGDIVPFKWYGDGTEYDLYDLNDALSSVADMPEDDELIVNIHTFGGCTTTAFAIYNKLRRFASQKKITVTTRIDGYCASAGVAIFLAGDKRIGNAYAEPFIHNAWTWQMAGDKKQAEKIYEDLKRTDNAIASLYAERTKINKEQALELMDADTTLTPEQAVEFGFYTEMENVLVVDTEVFNSLRDQRHNLNTDTMANKKQGIAKTVLNSVRKHLGLETLNLILHTADSEELDFYELEADATPSVGDKATFDGKPAGDSNDGTYVMASGETYKFTGEELTEIISADTDTEDSDDTDTENSADDSEEVVNLRARVATLENSVKVLKNNLKTTKAELATANALLNKVVSLDLSEEEDEEDTDAQARDPKPSQNMNKKGSEETRNILQSL